MVARGVVVEGSVVIAVSMAVLGLMVVMMVVVVVLMVVLMVTVVVLMVVMMMMVWCVALPIAGQTRGWGCLH